MSRATATHAITSNGVQPQRFWQPRKGAQTRESGYWTQSERRKQSGGNKDELDRARYLEQLGKREEAAWNQISAHIQKRQPNEYDKAVSLLLDLHDLAVRKQQVPEFQAALEKLREKHAAKESFLRRLSKARL